MPMETVTEASGSRLSAETRGEEVVEWMSDKGTMFSVGRNKVMGENTKVEEEEEEAAAEWNRQASNGARVFPPPQDKATAAATVWEIYPSTSSSPTYSCFREQKCSREGLAHFQNILVKKNEENRKHQRHQTSLGSDNAKKKKRKKNGGHKIRMWTVKEGGDWRDRNILHGFFPRSPTQLFKAAAFHQISLSADRRDSRGKQPLKTEPSRTHFQSNALKPPSHLLCAGTRRLLSQGKIKKGKRSENWEEECKAKVVHNSGLSQIHSTKILLVCVVSSSRLDTKLPWDGGRKPVVSNQISQEILSNKMKTTTTYKESK